MKTSTIILSILGTAVAGTAGYLLYKRYRANSAYVTLPENSNIAKPIIKTDAKPLTDFEKNFLATLTQETNMPTVLQKVANTFNQISSGLIKTQPVAQTAFTPQVAPTQQAIKVTAAKDTFAAVNKLEGLQSLVI